jgi:hypothetical protein
MHPRRDHNREDRAPDQFARNLGANRFDRREGDGRINRQQGRLDLTDHLGCHGLVSVLRLNPDHRHMLIGAEGRIEHFGDRHIAKVQRRQRRAIDTYVNGRRGFCANRRAPAEIDPEIQAHDDRKDDGGDHRETRQAQRRPLQAEEVDVGFFRSKPETHDFAP